MASAAALSASSATVVPAASRWADASARRLFFVVEALILVGILDTRRVDLGDLVTKKVDLSGSSSFVAAQFG